MIRVLHITPHMGGGVGRVLSGFVSYAQKGCASRHEIVCLDKPEKEQFITLAKAADCPVTVSPSDNVLKEKIESADIVQIEFWNHPTLLKLLCSEIFESVRVVFWCHTSGLNFPIIPAKLFGACHRFVFTSPCSYESRVLVGLSEAEKGRLRVISSGGGMDLLPELDRASGNRLRAGYVGSLNFSKLHPDYVSLLASVDDEDFSVRLIGDEANRTLLEEECRAIDRPELLEFVGYCMDIVAELKAMDLFVYLLNPTHYGTAEIALLEAMAMKVVPIVMNNSCESHIVEDGVTGLIVADAEQLADRVRWFADHEEQRFEMAENASREVRTRYTYARMDEQFNALYDEVMEMNKSHFEYKQIFGENAAEWFSSFVSKRSASFLDDGTVQLPEGFLRYAMFENTKGSAFHFASVFPDDLLLKQWCSALEGMR